MFFSLLSEKYKISPEGLNYYQFPEITNLKEYVMRYHGMLSKINIPYNKKIDFINNEIKNHPRHNGRR